MHILTQNMLTALQEAQPYMDFRPPRPVHALSDLHSWHEILSLYEALEDDASKETFMKLMAVRILYFTVPNEIVTEKFSLYPKAIWQKLLQLAENISGVQGDYILDRVETWILKGYEYGPCQAKAGDIAIDAGAFTGNTTTYLAQCVGEQGKVFAFEPMEEIFKALQRNTKHVPQIELFQAGLSHSDGHVYIEAQNHPGASLLQQGDVRVTIRSVDSFVQEKALERLDFIKMDIEGCEMDALNGAQHTIAKFTPKLAMCIYHRPNDIFQIYKRIIEINPHYTFYLKHCSNTLWETVLFCMPSNTAHTYTDCSLTFAQDVTIAHNLRDAYKNILDATKEN